MGKEQIIKKKNNIIKQEKGSIVIFVLVAILTMAAFLMLSIAGNINKIKVVKEREDIIKNIYDPFGDGVKKAH